MVCYDCVVKWCKVCWLLLLFSSKYSNELLEYVLDSFDALMVGCALEDVRLLLLVLVLLDDDATRVSAASSASRIAQRVRMV